MFDSTDFFQRRFPKCLVLFSFIFFCTSCDNFPKDTYGSLEAAKRDLLLVGYVENSPFVMEQDSVLRGIEVEIVEGFARSIGAEILWIRKNEQALLQDLENRNLHLVISGLSQKSPWNKKLGIVKSYVELNSVKHTIAVPPGEHALVFHLEKFLNKNESEIKEIVNRYTEKKRN